MKRSRLRTSVAGPPASIILLGLVLHPEAAHAQYIEQYLPSLIPGLDETRGLTVLQRDRPLYDEKGVRVDSFLLRGGIDERLGYNSNVTGTSNGPGSSYLETTPSVDLQSDWSRNRFGMSASADRFDYFSAARQSHTDWNVAVGGGWTVLSNTVDLGYSHLHGNEFSTDAGAVAAETPTPFDVDLVRAAYTVDLGRIKFTPNVDLRYYQFGTTVIGGQTVDERYRNRAVISGGVTGRYEFSSQRAFVIVLQGAHSTFVDTPFGTPSPDSTSFLILPGIDYQATGPWRYRLLVGFEVRSFREAVYGTETAPIFEGSVIWTPTRLTTVTATLRREIEDTQSETTDGFTTTAAELQLDHELRRNVLLHASALIQSVDYFQGAGSAVSFGFGGRATWLLDDHLSAFASYGFLRQNASSNHGNLAAPTVALPSFTQNIALIGVRWRL